MACTIDCDVSDNYPQNGQVMTLVNTVRISPPSFRMLTRQLGLPQ